MRHGYRHTKLYNTWRGMKERCTNRNHKNYSLYKDRWYKDWDSFVTFKDWALANGYEDGLTIDRIDSTKGYHPNNCRFVSAAVNTSKGNKERGYLYYIKSKWVAYEEALKLTQLKPSTFSYRVSVGKYDRRRGYDKVFTKKNRSINI